MINEKILPFQALFEFILNPKSEARNTKQIQNSNFSMFKTGTKKPVIHRRCEDKGFGRWDFGHLVLFRISDFDIRILNSLLLTISVASFRGLRHTTSSTGGR